MTIDTPYRPRSRLAPPRSADAPRVLMVDDDPAITAALRRQLRSRFRATTADSAAEALELVASAEEPFAAVVSDLKMPGMDGLTFLQEMSVRSPHTSRLLLTGYADLDTAIDALNGGYVFRFLCKPCASPDLVRALDDAVAQHRLVTSEIELLQRTLNHSIDALVETLALANPPAFSRAIRVRSLVTEILDTLEIDDRWHIEVAAMLSQLGAVTLPPGTADTLHRGGFLTVEERKMVADLPSLALRLIADIPRLDAVRAVITGLVDADLVAEDVPFGARVLRAALAFDEFDSAGLGLDAVIIQLRNLEPIQDPTVIQALADLRGVGQIGATAEIALDKLRVGMVLRGDVMTTDGLLLIGRGQLVSENLLLRIANFTDRIDPETVVEVRLG